ncbi:unnamed protein product, partial [Allacma fusca]
MVSSPGPHIVITSPSDSFTFVTPACPKTARLSDFDENSFENLSSVINSQIFSPFDPEMEASTLDTSTEFTSNLCSNLIEDFNSISLDMTHHPASVDYKIIPTSPESADVILLQKPQVIPIPEEFLQPLESTCPSNKVDTPTQSTTSEKCTYNSTVDFFTSALGSENELITPTSSPEVLPATSGTR